MFFTQAPLELKLDYLLVRTPKPYGGDVSTGDCIVVQAINRNMIPDAELYKVARLYRSLHDGVPALQQLRRVFGFRANIPNCDLARACQKLLTRFPKLIAFCQWEVAEAIDAMDKEFYTTNKNRVIGLWPQDEGSTRFSTYDNALQVKTLMGERGLKKPILLAHEDHMIRCWFLYRKLLKVDPIIPVYKVSSYDSQGVQPYARDRKTFRQYERFLARPHHIITGLV